MLSQVALRCVFRSRPEIPDRRHKFFLSVDLFGMLGTETVCYFVVGMFLSFIVKWLDFKDP
eukprot:4629426-Amphidinium_carterae.1